MFLLYHLRHPLLVIPLHQSTFNLSRAYLKKKKLIKKLPSMLSVPQVQKLKLTHP